MWMHKWLYRLYVVCRGIIRIRWMNIIFHPVSSILWDMGFQSPVKTVLLLLLPILTCVRNTLLLSRRRFVRVPCRWWSIPPIIAGWRFMPIKSYWPDGWRRTWTGMEWLWPIGMILIICIFATILQAARKMPSGWLSMRVLIWQWFLRRDSFVSTWKNWLRKGLFQWNVLTMPYDVYYVWNSAWDCLRIHTGIFGNMTSLEVGSLQKWHCKLLGNRRSCWKMKENFCLYVRERRYCWQVRTPMLCVVSTEDGLTVGRESWRMNLRRLIILSMKHYATSLVRKILSMNREWRMLLILMITGGKKIVRK